MESCPPAGLPNFGNSCYLNSALQALAASDAAADWLTSAAARNMLHAQSAGRDENAQSEGHAARSVLSNIVQLVVSLWKLFAAEAPKAEYPLLQTLAPLMHALSHPAHRCNVSSPLGAQCKRLLIALQQCGVPAADGLGDQQDAVEALEGMCHGAACEVRHRQHPCPGLLSLLRQWPASPASSSSVLPLMVGFKTGSQGNRDEEGRGRADSQVSKIGEVEGWADAESMTDTEEGVRAAKGASSGRLPGPKTFLTGGQYASSADAPPTPLPRHPPMRGVLLSSNVCDECDGCMGVNHAPFITLPLPVPYAVVHPGVGRVRPGTTLQHCMQAFVAPQAVEGLLCPRCTLRTAAAAAAVGAQRAPAAASTAWQAAAPAAGVPQHLNPSGTPQSSISSCMPQCATHTPSLCARDSALAAARAPACVPLPDLEDHELDAMLEALAQTGAQKSAFLRAEGASLASDVSSLDGVEAQPQLQQEECDERELREQVSNGEAAFALQHLRKDGVLQQAGRGRVNNSQHQQAETDQGHQPTKAQKAQGAQSARTPPDAQGHHTPSDTNLHKHTIKRSPAQGHKLRVRRSAVQHTSVGCLPQVLVLQLQRSRWDASCLTGPMKVQGHIRFPLELKPADLHLIQPPHLPRSLLQRVHPRSGGDHVSSGQTRSTAAAGIGGCSESLDPAKCVGSLSALTCSHPGMSHDVGYKDVGTAASRDSAPVGSAHAGTEADRHQPSHGMHNCSCCSYSLQAVMVHLGGAGGGHWLTYRRGIAQKNCKSAAHSLPLASKWYRMSDCSVTAVSEVEVLASHAGALVYQRVCLQDPKDSRQ